VVCPSTGTGAPSHLRGSQFTTMNSIWLSSPSSGRGAFCCEHERKVRGKRNTCRESLALQQSALQLSKTTVGNLFRYPRAGSGPSCAGLSGLGTKGCPHCFSQPLVSAAYLPLGVTLELSRLPVIRGSPAVFVAGEPGRSTKARRKQLCPSLRRYFRSMANPLIRR